MVVVRIPLFRRPLLTSSAMSFCEALPVNASRMPPGRECNCHVGGMKRDITSQMTEGAD